MSATIFDPREISRVYTEIAVDRYVAGAEVEPNITVGSCDLGRVDDSRFARLVGAIASPTVMSLEHRLTPHELDPLLQALNRMSVSGQSPCRLARGGILRRDCVEDHR